MEVATEFGVVTQDTEANGESDRLLTVTGEQMDIQEKNRDGKHRIDEDAKPVQMEFDEDENHLGKRANDDGNEEPTIKLTKLGTPAREREENATEFDIRVFS